MYGLLFGIFLSSVVLLVFYFGYLVFDEYMLVLICLCVMVIWNLRPFFFFKKKNLLTYVLAIVAGARFAAKVTALKEVQWLETLFLYYLIYSVMSDRWLAFCGFCVSLC